MKIDANTKLIGRFHKAVSPRTLNIYNPFFQDNGINAVYLLFHNDHPKVLINGFRSLNLAGAVAAGFESDPVLPTLLDEVDETAKFVGKIGYITNENGKLIGHTPGGKGMLLTLQSAMDLQGKNITIVGAGNITRGLLFEMEKEHIDCQITIYNKTLAKAQQLKDRFPFVSQIFEFKELDQARGDMFVNLTHIGKATDDSVFPEEVIAKFSHVVDVTFEIEVTPLISTARKLGKSATTGWEMFTFQGQVCLEGLLGIKIDPNVLRKYVRAGLSAVV